LSLASPAPLVHLIAVNVAKPSVIGTRRGRPVLSAIKKRPVTPGDILFLDWENLAGDRQADLSVHGGPDKAVYAYPTEHLPKWNAELNPAPPYGPGTFGENLSTAGWDETTARIGDVWAWGDAVLQVCQPRYPCFKLAMTTDRPDIGKRLLQTLRNGWYLRVLQPGTVPIAGPISVIERGPDEACVRDAVRAILPDGSLELAERIAAVPQLSNNWRRELQARLTD
jgi:MOSC domain-containing protein YiiM